MTKLIIIGGVAGGATAAARARRLDEFAQITVFERGPYVSFANCGLPYFVGGVIKERSDLLVSTPDHFKKNYNVDVRTFTQVEKIDRQQKTVLAKNLMTGQAALESYDKLILSPGAESIRPTLPGLDLDGVYSLRSIPDSDRIKALLDYHGPSSAVIVGGGFIGLEMAENLVHRGLEVTIIEMQPQVMPSFDPEMAALIEAHLKTKGVQLVLSAGLSSVTREDVKLAASTSNGQAFPCDLVFLSIGVKPENKLAREAGLDLAPSGHILIDETLRTSDPDIFAVGDAVLVKHFVTGRISPIPLAGPANRQGRLAADNALDRRSLYTGTLGTAVVKVFDRVAALTGASEKALKDVGMPCQVSYTSSASHASYYPGGDEMFIKLVFSPSEGRLLGAQVVGGEGVDKRIDVLATAVRARMSVFDLEELDLAYAPPFSSAKDPVNIAGHVAANLIKGDLENIYTSDLENLSANDVLLDLRTPVEIEKLGKIEGALEMELDNLRTAISSLDPSKRYICYCAVGQRGYVGCRILTQNGFRAVNLSGGYNLVHPAG